MFYADLIWKEGSFLSRLRMIKWKIKNESPPICCCKQGCGDNSQDLFYMSELNRFGGWILTSQELYMQVTVGELCSLQPCVNKGCSNIWIRCSDRHWSHWIMSELCCKSGESLSTLWIRMKISGMCVGEQLWGAREVTSVCVIVSVQMKHSGDGVCRRLGSEFLCVGLYSTSETKHVSALKSHTHTQDSLFRWGENQMFSTTHNEITATLMPR